MRDPQRIDTVLAAVREYWTANPDFRLAQIISNAASAIGCTDSFFLEDTELLETLQGGDQI